MLVGCWSWRCPATAGDTAQLKRPGSHHDPLPLEGAGACSGEQRVVSVPLSGTFSPYRAVEAPGPGGEEAVRQGVPAGFPVYAGLYPEAGGAAAYKRRGSRQGERRAYQTGTCWFFILNRDPHALYCWTASLQGPSGKGKYSISVTPQNSPPWLPDECAEMI